ncbi:MAG: DUF1311 domain-containing protein [Alphaproteobacteria bacterium]|nr:DUF1311 domain-containing protein [Alphaproteobacteria bacterium]MBU1514237.1 DUF1311 domain-containing protein [Alphaproteobacteria bacterium]MBU2093317.1 DUF1311 domain-containing protein [Alphaproteobacteria bacterium]MBU2153408.1 DUF1311 domain-containing protein [Alphaproteobacteria bacterium]MBU2307099.1 DUF1311 domain-containing protein [Alphaproteobacteria bacterium]
MLDYSEDLPPDPPVQKPPRPGRLVLFGVVSAMALGVGMGLWARPDPPAPPHPATMAPEDAPRPALQIVVDDTPAPLGPLLEVLPGEAAPYRETAAPPPEIAAPRRTAAGLMKVDAIIAPEPPLLVPTVRVEPKPRPAPRIEAPPEKPKVQKAKAEPKPKPEKLRVADAKPKTVDKAKVEKAKAAKLIETAKAQKLAKAEKVQKAEKAKAVKLAQAEARREKTAKAKAAETKRLAALVKAVKATPKTLKAEVAKTKTQLAQAKAARKPKVEKASTKPVIAKPPPKKPVAKKPVPIGQGPMRVARNDACASPDPGQAVVCADRRLGARDRQLQQAYRNAEAAGVPASSLQRQQARWLQARAAAAREAPWAVEDVYEARISELNDLTRDAREN